MEVKKSGKINLQELAKTGDKKEVKDFKRCFHNKQMHNNKNKRK